MRSRESLSRCRQRRPGPGGPAGDHPSVGGRGVFGSADSPLVGVSTLGYPSEHADPLDSAFGGLASSA